MTINLQDFGAANGIEEISAGGRSFVAVAGDAAANDLDFSSTMLTGIVGIDGGGGDDVIRGSLGDDVVTGGAGSDAFVFGEGFGRDTVSDFQDGDIVEFRDGVFLDFAAVQAVGHQDGADTIITLNATDTLILHNVVLSSLNADDFRFV